MEQFFSGKSVFITGATSFIGRVLLEKILRTLDVSKVYLLIRPRRRSYMADDVISPSQILQTRLREEILDSPVFNGLREQSRLETLSEKIVPIGGDVLMENLGLSQEDFQQVVENTSLVFHFAGSRSLRLPVMIAVKAVAQGSLNAMDLAYKMKRLEGFLVLSTVYVNFNKPGTVIEALPVLGPKRMATSCYSSRVNEQIADKILDDVLRSHSADIAEKLMRNAGYENPFPFAWALAELAMSERRASFPLLIVRPSWIAPTLREPSPGLLDPVGVSSYFLAVASGVTDLVPGKPGTTLDLIPADLVVNTCLVFAKNFSGSNGMRICHCSTAQLNPLRTEDAFDVICRNLNLPSVLLVSGFDLESKSFFLKNRLVTLSGMLAFTPKQRRYKTEREISRVQDQRALLTAFKPFFTREWVFWSLQGTQLISMMNDSDVRSFNMDPRKIDWQWYLENFVRSLREKLRIDKNEHFDSAQLPTLVAAI